MGCNADKDTRSDVPCTHRRVLECQDCRCTFAVRYTDDAIQSLLDRVKELESKLGAALSGISSAGATVGSGRHDATSDHNDTQQAGKTASGPPAAPSVSAQRWLGKGLLFSGLGDRDAARACDLAAALTEAYESTKHLAYEWHPQRVSQFTRIALAFVRGEPLSQKEK